MGIVFLNHVKRGCDEAGCGCSTGCIIFDNSGDGDLSNFNVVDFSDATMSGGVLTLTTGAVYPLLGRDFCAEKKCWSQGIGDTDTLDDLLINFILRFRVNVTDTESVIRFAEKLPIPSGSVTWPAQQIVQSGSASSGTWGISAAQCGPSAPSLAYNASASDVQFAANILESYADPSAGGFTASITSGTAPNATYLLTFAGITGWVLGKAGQLPTLSVTNSTDTGSFAVSVVEDGPAFPTPVSYWELRISTAGIKFNYIGPNAYGCASGSGVTLTYNFPYNSPCNQTISEGWHSFVLSGSPSNKTDSPAWATRSFGYPGDILTGFYANANGEFGFFPVLTMDGNPVQPNRNESIGVINQYPTPDDQTTWEFPATSPPFEAQNLFLFKAGPYISGPSFRTGEFDSIRGDCLQTVGSDPCPGTYVSTGCDESETLPPFLKISGINLSAMLSNIRSEFTSISYQGAGNVGTTTDITDLVAELLQCDNLILAKLTPCQPYVFSPDKGPYTIPFYGDTCVGNWIIQAVLSTDPVTLDVPVLVTTLPDASDPDYPNGYNVVLGLMGVAWRTYDTWQVRIGTGFQGQVDGSLASALIYAEFISCPSNLTPNPETGIWSVAGYAASPPPTLVNTFGATPPCSEFVSYGFVTGNPFIDFSAFAEGAGPFRNLLPRAFDGNGWWAQEDGYIGQNDTDGNPETGLASVDDIAIEPVTETPDGCPAGNTNALCYLITAISCCSGVVSIGGETPGETITFSSATKLAINSAVAQDGNCYFVTDAEPQDVSECTDAPDLTKYTNCADCLADNSGSWCFEYCTQCVTSGLLIFPGMDGVKTSAGVLIPFKVPAANIILDISDCSVPPDYVFTLADGTTLEVINGIQEGNVEGTDPTGVWLVFTLAFNGTIRALAWADSAVYEKKIATTVPGDCIGDGLWSLGLVVSSENSDGDSSVSWPATIDFAL